ncbi:triose-phosphate isomerase [Patescibacteria group bacterium]|jgi:triosephosphate isomerase|nr:triose-phosphate isomerase [Patescibacteria group bacterium]MDQ5919548.1 Triosephosphate isomerase [Patescibacteria group bacterium]
MRKLLIANWKMMYGPVKAGAWIRAFRRERLPKDVDIAVAVPHISLPAAKASLGRASVPFLAAQNVSWMNEGAMTGEIAPSMLLELGVSMCIVGHSERRRELEETDAMVAKKIAALQKAGIQPIVCVGETEAQKKKGKAEALKAVRAQVQSVIAAGEWDTSAPAIVIAYEPVWAIGSGKACPPLEAKEMHEAIRESLKKKLGEEVANRVQIVYGGSVDPRNVADYLSTTGIDGALVGSASLDPRLFGMLCRAASTA